MDDTPRRKLTKAEAGRKGGQTTRDRYGREHYVRAGKLGFQALAKARGFMGGSRLGTLQWLYRKGKLRVSPEDLQRYREAQEFFDQFWRDFDPENPNPKADR